MRLSRHEMAGAERKFGQEEGPPHSIAQSSHAGIQVELRRAIM
ncbi:hypothetical protein [Rhizobium sp. Root708]|nr:hypothetical protein [Rhizobium sp. Root708]